MVIRVQVVELVISDRIEDTFNLFIFFKIVDVLLILLIFYWCIS
jgi:hypothetical protein